MITVISNYFCRILNLKPFIKGIKVMELDITDMKVIDIIILIRLIS